jgi:phosphoglycolate phosphatase-like HAD superfamily hydrolase
MTKIKIQCLRTATIERISFLSSRLVPLLYFRILLLAVGIVLAAWCTAPIVAQAVTDPLPSWNDGSSKHAILDFVRDTTTVDSPDFVPPSKRIAAFDQDGTLWVEQPFYTEMAFSLDRIKAMAPKHPEWKTAEPYATLFLGNRSEIEKFTIGDIEQIVATTHSGMTIEAFQDIVGQWLASATHPRFKRPYTQLVYQPMLEVIQYLRDSGYQTYIVTGGGQDFVRVYSEQTYGVPPEHVIGSAEETEYKYSADGKAELIKVPKLLLLDDKKGKPRGINLMIGQRPYAAFGNSTGDKEMLEWTQSGGGRRLMMLVHHDDADREYSYGPDSKIGTFSDALMAESKKQGWVVISIKNDWKTVFK